MTTKTACTDDDDGYVTQEIRVISIPICMIIDMMAFKGAYGHKTALETKRTNPAFREAFQVYPTEMATNREDEFWASWKDFRARYPVEDHPSSAAGLEHQRLRTLHADSEDEVIVQENAAVGVAGTLSLDAAVPNAGSSTGHTAKRAAPPAAAPAAAALASGEAARPAGPAIRGGRAGQAVQTNKDD
jgi:hypothetical protein